MPYRDWKDLKRNVVLPAVNEINQHGEEGGFFVTYEGVREGKTFTKIRFTLAKSAKRDDRDMMLQGRARAGKGVHGVSGRFVQNCTLSQASAVLGDDT